jgi:choline dehydrogenase-like flavoprotein
MALPLAAFPALAQAGIGLSQLIGGALTNVPDLPTYQPTQATQQAVNMAEREANASLMPGYAEATQQINQNTSNAVNTVAQNASSSSDIMNAAGAAQVRGNMSLSDLVRANMQDKARRKGVHLQTLGQLAAEQNKAWQINEQQPYLDAAATKSALMGAGLQTLTDAGSQYAAYAQMQPPKQKEVVSLPTAPAPIGYMDLINSTNPWQDILNNLNK